MVRGPGAAATSCVFRPPKIGMKTLAQRRDRGKATVYEPTGWHIEASAKEREQLLARIEHLEGEVRFLREHLTRAQSG